MMHEFKLMMASYIKAKSIGLKSVMATVVDLDGSSYRRPGVRMLINENGQMTGAVSGGCVEKEILKQSHSVFKNNHAKIMTYDGRYRLGCEGMLYILIEPFSPSKSCITAFQKCIEQRDFFHIESSYSREVGHDIEMGSQMVFKNQSVFNFNELNHSLSKDNKLLFKDKLKANFKLIIFGAEHDAVQLCHFASHLGWDVEVITSPSNPSTLKDFPGAQKIHHQNAEMIDLALLNQKETAIVLMTHSYVKDLQYLLALKSIRPNYIGLLGPAKRREKLLNDFIEQTGEIEDEFFNLIHGPAGLNLGAETPQEIAISICSEILAVLRARDTKSLKYKQGQIHST